MNGDTHSEDQTLLAALEALERGIDAPREPRADETTETLTRLYIEELGLIAYELEPVPPSPGARERLMAAIHGDETQPAVSEPAPVAPIRPATVEARAPRPVAGAAVARRTSRWPLALAAGLALALLGLSAWLFTQVGAQRAEIARLEREVAAERARADQAAEEVRRAQADVLDMRQKFQLVTSPAVEISPMRPAGEPPLQPGASGMLFVAADHQHWYMRVRGLQPAAQGKAYTLWFVTDQGMVKSGHFSGRSGEPEELSSATMPAGTRSAMVTLEDNPDAPAPTGPEVLRAAATYPIS